MKEVGKELAKTRARMMWDMDKYIYDEIGDEDIIDYWLGYGVPDGSTYSDRYEMAQSDDIWINVVRVFANCLEMAGIIENEKA